MAELSIKDSGVDLTRLTGQENYHQWIRNFKLIADLKGVWGIISREDDAVTKPVRTDYFASVKIKNESGMAHEGPQAPDEDVSTRMAEYKIDLEEYTRYEKNCRIALSVLAYWVDPSIRGKIQSFKSPHDAFKWIQTQYKMQDVRSLDLALTRLEALHLSQCKSIQEYLNKHEMYRMDVEESGGSYPDDQLLSKIIRGLTHDYAPFVDQYYFLYDTAVFGKDQVDLKAITGRLLTFESKLREKNNNKNVNYANAQAKDNPKRDRRNTGNTNRPKCEYELCGKWGHSTDRCWVKNPDLKKERAKHNKSNEHSGDSKTAVETKEKEKTTKRIVAMAFVNRADLHNRLSLPNSSMHNPSPPLSSHKIDTIRPQTTSSESGGLLRGDEMEQGVNSQKGGTWQQPKASTTVAMPESLSARKEDVTARQMALECTSSLNEQSDVLHDRDADDGIRITVINHSEQQSAISVHNYNADDGIRITMIDDSEPLPNQKTPNPSSLDPYGRRRFMNSIIQNRRLAEMSGYRRLRVKRPVPMVMFRRICVNRRHATTGLMCQPHSTKKAAPQDQDCVPHTNLGSMVNLLVPATDDLQHDTWLADTGANSHIVNDTKWFTDLTPLSYKVNTADDQGQLQIYGIGTALIYLTAPDGDMIELEISNAAYAPSSRCNLLSLSAIAEKAGLKGCWSKTGMTIETQDGYQIGLAPLIDGLYHIQLAQIQEHVEIQRTVTLVSDEVWNWHRRLGHLSFDSMRKLLKISQGISLTDKQIKAKLGAICPICATTKATVNIPRDPASRRAQSAGELVHVDTWVPFNTRGWDGTLEFLKFTDDYTRMTWSVRLPNKHVLFSEFRKLHRRIEKRHNITIRAYRFNNEFVSNAMKDWTAKHGITQEPTAPYAHYQVGVAERTNRTHREAAAAIMQDAAVPQRLRRIFTEKGEESLRNTNLPAKLWPEAVDHAIWLRNRAPTRALKNKMTPWERLTNAKPDMSRERVWGSRAYVTVTAEERLRRRHTKLTSPRAWLGYFVGCESESIYRIYNPETKIVQRISVARIEDNEGLQDEHDEPAFSENDRNRDSLPGTYSVSDENQDDESQDEENQDENNHQDDSLNDHFGNEDHDDEENSHASDEEDSEEDSAPTRSRFFAHVTQRKSSATADNAEEPPVEEESDAFEDTDEDKESDYSEEGDKPVVTRRKVPYWKREQEDLTNNCARYYVSNLHCDQKVPLCSACVTAKRHCRPYEPYLERITDGRQPRAEKCRKCAEALPKVRCDGGKCCTRCKDKHLICRPQSEEELQKSVKIDTSSKGMGYFQKCIKCQQRGLRCDGKSPCGRCQKENHKCIPGHKEEGRVLQNGVLASRRCYRYKKIPTLCNGETPCDVCSKSPRHAQTCRIGKAKPVKCVGCKSSKMYCDGKNPCTTCTKLHQKKPKMNHCTYHEDGSQIRSKYHFDQEKYPPSESCRTCITDGRTCDKNFPCGYCKANFRPKMKCCTYWTKDRTQFTYSATESEFREKRYTFARPPKPKETLSLGTST